MAASDHLNPQQFFHTTSKVLEPGTKLVPGMLHNEVFMSKSLDDARGWGGAISGGHIYQVQPQGKILRDHPIMGLSQATAKGATVLQHVETMPDEDDDW